MSKRPLTIEEPGAAPADVPGEAAAAVDGTDQAELAPELASPVVEVSPPLIEQPTGHLPDQADVDPSKIKTNTLTKQGWVLPTSAVTQAAG